MAMSTNIVELRERYMKLYLNLMMLKSHDLKTNVILQPFREKLAEFNEEAIHFFEQMGGFPEEKTTNDKNRNVGATRTTQTL